MHQVKHDGVAITVLLVGVALGSAGGAAAQGVIHTIQGGAVGDKFGRSASRAGDVDADGFADVVAGAPCDDDFGKDSGSAHVLSGRDGSVIHSFFGDNLGTPVQGDQFGQSASEAGDIDADGWPDVIIGAGFDSNGLVNAGNAWVFSGKDGSVLFRFDGDATGDQFGFSVSGGGDVNADGFPDVIVGALNENDPNGQWDGTMTVFSGLDGSQLFDVPGPPVGPGQYSSYPYSLEHAGDVDQDGFGDVIAGAPTANSGVGLAVVCSGKTGGILRTFHGQPGDNLGRSVSGAGDVDLDGYADVIVGGPNSFQGVVLVLSGRNGAVLRSWQGDPQAHLGGFAHLGGAVAGAGDVDGDGVPDLVFSATEYPDAVSPIVGVAQVRSGSDGSLLHVVSSPGGWWFGGAVENAGDVNGDGVPDLVSSSTYNSSPGPDAGVVILVSGGCGSMSVYGAGCPGTGGHVPALAATGCAAAGASLTLELSEASGGASAFLFVGAQQASVPVGGGCSLLVWPPVGPIGPIPLAGIGPGTGSVSLPLKLPIPAPSGASYVQAFVVDAGGGAGFSTSNAVEITVE